MDLAFVDLQLAEGSSGLDAADYIHDVWPGALIVFVTANARKLLPDIEKGQGVIEKPFSHRAIGAVLGFLHQEIRTPPPMALAPYGLFMNSKLEKMLKLT